MRLGWNPKRISVGAFSFEWHMRRIIILGGPRVGKTTLSRRLQKEFGIQTLNCADDLKDLGWSESSETASKWFSDQGEWIAEGVQMARALRKWLKANPDAPLDVDVLYLKQPFVPLLPGQLSMAKGVRTVFGDIEADLVSRGARVHELKDPEDAIDIFRGVDMAEENDEGKEPKPDNKETAGLKKRLDKHQGDAMALAAELSAENADLNRQLRAAKGDKPKEGSVTLTPEQARQWEAFIALGKPEEIIVSYQAYKEHGTPEEVKTKITEHANLSSEHAQLKKVEQLRQIADAGIGGKKLKVSVLQTLDQQAGGLTYEERDVTVTENGKTETKKAWHVKDNNKWVPLSEFSESHWKDFGPALLADAPNGNGTKVPSMAADDRNKGVNIYDDIRKQAAEAQKQQIESIPLEKRLHMA